MALPYLGTDIFTSLAGGLGQQIAGGLGPQRIDPLEAQRRAHRQAQDLAARQYALGLAERRSDIYRWHTPSSKDKTIRAELQEETDEWLEGRFNFNGSKDNEKS